MAPSKWDANATVGDNVTVSATLFDSTLTNFVAYFPTSLLNASFLSACRGDYQDIRFYTTAGVELDRYITTGGSCFVRLPSASSSVSTVLDVNGGSGVSKGNDITALTTAGYYNWLNADETSGNLIDITGNYDGTASNLTYSQTGKIENAVGFNDGNSNVDIGSSVSEIRSASSFSVCLWVNFDDLTADTEVLFSIVNTATERVQMNKSGVGAFITECGDASNKRQRTYDLTLYPSAGTFHHTAFVYNGSETEVYINGSVATPSSSSGITPSSTGTYPSDSFYWGNNFNLNIALGGDMDLMRLNSNALSADYIKAQYNNENDYASYVTESNYTVFGGGGRITNLLNPQTLGNSGFYSLVG